jgi:hypothetical protein
VGDWRIIFDAARGEIVVLAIAHRSSCIARSLELNKTVQIIVSPSGERLAVLPEDDYLLLLAASKDDEGEVEPSFLEELRRRRQRLAAGEETVPLADIRGKRR